MRRTCISLAVVALSSTASATDLDVLAEALYFEARSEPIACQVVIAQSILNRVKQVRYPDTIEGVVRQKKWVNDRWVCQYSYYCDGLPDVMANLDAQIRAYQVASRVLEGDLPDFSHGSDHYYNPKKARPNWGPLLERKFVCGEHLFGNLKW